MELLIVRHGVPARPTDDTAADAGHPADPGLSPVGEDEARRVAEWLAAEPIVAAYSSPLQRARETAEPFADRSGLPVRVLDGLAEWDRDADAYVHMEDLQARGDPVWQAMARGDLAALGIDPAAFRARVVDAFATIAAAHPSSTVAVFCHGGVINTYTADVAGIERTLWFAPTYGGVSRVRVSSTGVRSIVSLNETGHLRPPAPS